MDLLNICIIAYLLIGVLLFPVNWYIFSLDEFLESEDFGSFIGLVACDFFLWPVIFIILWFVFLQEFIVSIKIIRHRKKLRKNEKTREE